ncbi:MAG: class I SAM-dependent methyltransferase [Actinobacteria bacterium]|nr:class I SAM-dependent methyltransferase [Actinomycetota bacterium]
MNAEHLDLCSSEGWRDLLRDFIVPYALAGGHLGDDVLEVGPGPGMTTDLLRAELIRLTALEIDEDLAAALTERLRDTNVEVVRGDATSMPFEDARFSGAVSFTMLHHVPTETLQNQLFAEVARVVRPGALFVASDSVASNELQELHHDDTYNPIDPSTIEDRLRAAGFAAVEVRDNGFGWAAHATT